MKPPSVPTKILGAPKNQKFKPGGKMHCDIHGDIHLHPVHRAIIDTPQFQRLRHTKQLGMASFVYATAHSGKNLPKTLHLKKK